MSRLFAGVSVGGGGRFKWEGLLFLCAVMDVASLLQKAYICYYVRICGIGGYVSVCKSYKPKSAAAIWLVRIVLSVSRVFVFWRGENSCLSLWWW